MRAREATLAATFAIPYYYRWMYSYRILGGISHGSVFVSRESAVCRVAKAAEGKYSGA